MAEEEAELEEENAKLRSELESFDLFILISELDFFIPLVLSAVVDVGILRLFLRGLGEGRTADT